MFAISALTAFALLCMPVTLAAPMPGNHTSIESTLRAALHESRATSPPSVNDIKHALLSTRDAAFRPVRVSVDAYAAIHQIGSSTLGYWESIGPTGVTLMFNGEDFTTEMFQYYIFKETGEWPPLKGSGEAAPLGGGTNAERFVPMSAQEVIEDRQKAKEIEKTVKCGIIVKQGKEEIPVQNVRLLRQEPWYQYDQGPDNHIDSVVCITEW